MLQLKHKIVTRWTHWANSIVLLLMIWSGILIYWAHDVYHITIGSLTLKFFPDWFYSTLRIPSHLADGMAIHFTLMWLFAIIGLTYVIHTLVSGEWRHLVPGRNALPDAISVTLIDAGLKRGPLPPQGRYNAAQQIAYSSIILMGLGSILTGFAIYKPTQLAWLTWLFGGYETARLIHFALTLGYLLFLVIHVLQVIRAGWHNFTSMISGYEPVGAPATNTLPGKVGSSQ
ncbi:MAG: cytochrome b/b6 domain-containing protein [Bryobacteraceae bacterium]|nr:cytochrome b/b6 domain-containing protein [Bryobacteraceae bacterium]